MSDNRKAKTINTLNTILTGAVYILYPLLVLFLAAAQLFSGHLTGELRADTLPGVLSVILVPGISFVLVSIFRYVYNAPRPYEMPGAPEPIIKKDSPGKSFPSRHAFSIFIIAMTFFRIWPACGILIGIAGVILAICRVIGGVHFPRDVIAGALIGIACGILGYYIIPLC